MKRKLLDTVRDKIRFKHYSYQTEKAYVGWIKQFIFFHNKRHPNEMGKAEIEQFLTHLAVNKMVSPATQNQAFSALLFLYTQVLGIDLKDQNIQALSAGTKTYSCSANKRRGSEDYIKLIGYVPAYCIPYVWMWTPYE